MILRDYQEEIVERNLDAMRRGVKSTLNGLFTGAGKTVIFCSLADRIPGRTLIICPLRELVWQAVDKVREITDADPDIEMADFYAESDYWPSKVIVASKQTLFARRGGEPRYKRFDGFDLVIVDEAHLMCSDAVVEMLRYFNAQGAMVAGFTATPFRQDGHPMLETSGLGYYQESLCNYDLPWAIEHGWATRPVCRLARVASLDLSGIKVSGGDFNQEALRTAIEAEATLHRLAIITEQERVGQTVVFTPSVASAKAVCHYLNYNYDVPATYVYGTMPDEERAEALRRFKAKEVQVLVNCQVVAVGFDYPPTQTLILGRPTKSRSFWLQCVGRATRPLPGVVDFAGSTPESRRAAIAASDKPHFKIVDCTDSSLDHRLITSVDMFVAGDPAVKDAVKKAALEAPAPLTQEELEAIALRELEKQRIAQEIEARRQSMKGRATGSVVGRDVDLQFTGRRSVGTYTNPLKGKYAGYRMSELPDHYVEWGERTLKGWVRQLFSKELQRRWNTRVTY